MELRDRVMVVTGAGQGLGRALAAEGAARGARLVLVDIDEVAVTTAASELAGLAVTADLGRLEGVRAAIEAARAEFGTLDIWCSNAALSGAAEIDELSDERWDSTWHVNVMAHVWAARELLPAWLDRGQGCLLQTVSAVALTLNHWDASYAVTKRAALALSEYLATRYGPRGIVVSAFCPRGMLTDRLKGSLDRLSPAARNAMKTAVTAERAAEIALDGLQAERFLILTEEDELASHRRKAQDIEGWIKDRQEQAAHEAGARDV